MFINIAPSTAPIVFKIKSSISKIPHLKINCELSTSSENKKLKNKILKMLMFLYLKYAPKGKNQPKFPKNKIRKIFLLFL